MFFVLCYMSLFPCAMQCGTEDKECAEKRKWDFEWGQIEGSDEKNEKKNPSRNKHNELLA